jgi:hypothetical protein
MLELPDDSKHERRANIVLFVITMSGVVATIIALFR